MKNKHLNSQVVLEIICFTLFGVSLLYLTLSDKYLKYVTPRTKPYLIFASIVVFIWVCSLFRNLFIPQYKKHTLHCLVLILPVMVMLLPHNSVSSVSQSGSNGFMKGNTTVTQPEDKASDTVAPIPDSSQSGMRPSQDKNQNVDKSTSSELGGEYKTKDQYGSDITVHGLDLKNRSITVSDDEFLKWTNVIFLELDKFNGYSVTVTGSVMKNTDYLEKDEFVPARLVMTCCVADLVPCGFICKYDKISELQADSWVMVTGTVFKGSFNNKPEPQLKVTQIKSADKIEEFLYP